MASDAAPRKPGLSRELWHLPNVTHVEVVRAHYKPPRPHVIQQKMRPVHEAVEIVIQTDGPIPERALAPVLFVGDVVLTESEPAGPLRYRFFAFDFDKLTEGAPLSLGWTMNDSPKVPTKFHYKVEYLFSEIPR